MELVILECWRLQDFPDIAHDKAKESGADYVFTNSSAAGFNKFHK